MAHTEGTWTYESSHEPVDHQGCSVEAVMCNGMTIAEVMTVECNGEVGCIEGFANARLIAAAPDMLAALIDAEDELQRLKYCLGSVMDVMDKSVVHKARNAIVKAGARPSSR